MRYNLQVWNDNSDIEDSCSLQEYKVQFVRLLLRNLDPD